MMQACDPALWCILGIQEGSDELRATDMMPGESHHNDCPVAALQLLCRHVRGRMVADPSACQ